MTDTSTVTLSTGQTVEIPLSARATIVGAVFSARRRAVDALLPEGVRPIPATPRGRAAVTLLSVEYHALDAAIEPYDEFGVIVPAVHESPPTVPYLSALWHATSGYVHVLPVTTDSARALGVDVWGYPKVVADVTHEDRGARRRTTVTLDGERFVTVAVERPPTVPVSRRGYNYTVDGGDLREVPTEFDGEMGGWPFSGRVAVDFGRHERARELDRLDLRRRALGRVAASGTVRFHPGVPIGRA
jgi:hypothetical protein